MSPPLCGEELEGALHMKYIKPRIESHQAECTEIIAVSIIDGGTADDSEVLTKENNDWDIWDE